MPLIRCRPHIGLALPAQINPALPPPLCLFHCSDSPSRITARLACFRGEAFGRLHVILDSEMGAGLYVRYFL